MGTADLAWPPIEASAGALGGAPPFLNPPWRVGLPAWRFKRRVRPQSSALAFLLLACAMLFELP